MLRSWWPSAGENIYNARIVMHGIVWEYRHSSHWERFVTFQPWAYHHLSHWVTQPQSLEQAFTSNESESDRGLNTEGVVISHYNIFITRYFHWRIGPNISEFSSHAAPWELRHSHCRQPESRDRCLLLICLPRRLPPLRIREISLYRIYFSYFIINT